MYQPKYRISPYLLNLIDESRRLLSWIEGASVDVPWLPFLQKEAKNRATHSSTAIEGNPLTLHQVEAIAKGEKTGVPQVYEKEVANYLRAMQWIEKRNHLPLNESNVLKMHALLMEGILPYGKGGKYKDKQNYVINEKGIRIYTPPSPADTPKMMIELLEWLNSKETENLHSVLACAIFHHRFVSIHPFTDGNGRMARLISTWILYKRNFDTQHIFSLDDFFAGNRQHYYKKIEQARELDDNLTAWIEYVTEGIVKTLGNAKKRIEDLQVTSKHKILLTPKQEEILRHLRDKPFVNGMELRKSLKVTRARINQILTPLMQSGLVEKEGESRATRYRLR